MELFVLPGLGLVLVAQALLYRVARRQQQQIDALDERVGRLVAGISLLTDTTECGLRDVAQEIGRAAQAPAKRRTNATVTRRIRTAARRGRNVNEIAAAEQVSEGEVRLRLKLAEATQSGASDAALR